MCGLHRSKQNLPKKLFPYASDRSAYGCHCGISLNELFGRFSRLPPDIFGFGRPRKDSFCDPYWELPLQGNALWLEKCRGYLPKDDDQDVWAIVREKHLDLYWWYGGKEQGRVGMTTGWVRAGFLHTWTWPTSQDPHPDPAQLLIGFFFGPKPAPLGPV